MSVRVKPGTIQGSASVFQITDERCALNTVAKNSLISLYSKYEPYTPKSPCYC